MIAVRYRYFCAECCDAERYGAWHDTASGASRDAREHAATHPDHYPYL